MVLLKIYFAVLENIAEQKINQTNRKFYSKYNFKNNSKYKSMPVLKLKFKSMQIKL